MPSVNWSRPAVALCGLLVALGCLNPTSLADVREDEVDLSLSEDGRAFTNSLGMTFVPVRKGTFLMGSPNNENSRQPDEQQHKVELTRDFYLGTTEVTQKQYQAVMGKNPSAFSKTGSSSGSVQGIDTSDFPVESVKYEDAVAFMDKLNARDRRRSGWKYALPTEAQWEYACRGGPDTTAKPIRFAQPADSLSSTQANFLGNSPYNGGQAGPTLNRTAKVGSYKPNNLGIYDMPGNVWEWVHDWYAADYGGTNVTRDPTGPTKGMTHVIKGGAYYNDGSQCRSARRYPCTSADSAVGFRAAFVRVP